MATIERTVFGVGYNSKDTPTKVSGKATPEYRAWKGMLQRAYSDKYSANNPTYSGVSVCPTWHDFTVFAEWHALEPNAGLPGFDLDKDLRIPGNKVYGPSSCSYVPCQINSLLYKGRGTQGKLPVGVQTNGKRYQACLSVGGRRISLGTYTTPDQASVVYSAAKQQHVRSMAMEYREYLHPEVYEYLHYWGPQQG